MIFINCTQSDNDFLPLVSFVEENNLEVLDALQVEGIPAGAMCAIYGNSHKEFLPVNDGALTLTFEHGGTYEVKIIAPGYKEVFNCEVAPFRTV